MTDTDHKGTAMITGASSGIGAIYADRLARRGHDLILVARNGDRLRALASRLSDTTGRAVETVVADLTDAADLSRVETVLRTDASITMLVNNAGVGAAGSLLVSDVNRMSDMIALNVGAVTRLTYAVVPGFVARGAGTIVNIASIVAIAPEVLNGVYGGSKAFVLGLSQSLHPGPGGSARRDSNRVLGHFWLSAGQSAVGDRHVGRGHGRRGTRGPRPGRVGDHSGTARRRGLESLRGRPPDPGTQSVARQACRALRQLVEQGSVR